MDSFKPKLNPPITVTLTCRNPACKLGYGVPVTMPVHPWDNGYIDAICGECYQQITDIKRSLLLISSPKERKP